MGAMEFVTYSEGETSSIAFNNAKEKAFYDVGHQGYSGTIAEKNSFRMVPMLKNETLEEAIDRCLEDDTHFCQDKWGDAGCIWVEEDTWVFFGYASS
jgi:hypothetical protein